MRWWQRTPKATLAWYVRHTSGGVIGPFSTRAEAEVEARYMTETDGLPKPERKTEVQRIIDEIPGLRTFFTRTISITAEDHT